MALTLNIGRIAAYQGLAVADFANASEYFTNVRDGLNMGARDFPDGRVFDDGKHVATISYNGRVWASPGGDLLYDPSWKAKP